MATLETEPKPGPTPLEEVTAALTSLDEEGPFATELVCDAGDLHIEVKGVGPIGYPVSSKTARKLCAVAKPAPFGQREKTHYDKKVRDTFEIGAHLVKINEHAWNKAFAPQLVRIGQRLGMPAGAKLAVVLDKMLVYGPGQLFAAHQDSERVDTMVGSVVVELPSERAGGSIVVHHHKQKKVLGERAQRSNELSVAAFYADCHHEVLPVKSGYRIVLTYHLLYLGTADDDGAGDSDVDDLATSVSEYFSRSKASRYGRLSKEVPDRLVFLLDHQYTEKSLGWKQLKGSDGLRANALRRVAERLDCEVFLALADVHENWSCEGDDRFHRGRYGWYEDGIEDRDSDDYELYDLNDGDVELRCWVGVDGRRDPARTTALGLDEVCFTRASVEMDPFRSEHEGYMGNYGNTVDRWYHRAAVVMWPRSRNFEILAKDSPDSALKELASRIKKGSLDSARNGARQLLPFWARVAPREPKVSFNVRLLDILIALDDEGLSFELLSPFGSNLVSARGGVKLSRLIERHGANWAQRLFTKWAENRRYQDAKGIPGLTGLCEALVAGRQGKAFAAWLLESESADFKKHHTQELQCPLPYEDPDAVERLKGLVQLLRAATIVGAPSIQEGLVSYLIDPKTALPVAAAALFLEECTKESTLAVSRKLGVGTLYSAVVRSLEEIVARPPRRADDWSIVPPRGCNCDLCAELAKFLRDPTRTEHAWPLGKDRRQHIHRVIDLHRLPVKHQTIRSGRPQTLMLVKRKVLFDEEAALLVRHKSLLASLRKLGRTLDGGAQ